MLTNGVAEVERQIQSEAGEAGGLGEIAKLLQRPDLIDVVRRHHQVVCVAVCCSVVQCVERPDLLDVVRRHHQELFFVAVCCSVLQCVPAR